MFLGLSFLICKMEPNPITQGWMRTGTGTLGLRRGSDFRVRVISPLFPLVDSGGRRSMQKVGRRSGWSLSWVTSSRSLHLSGLYFMHEYC